MYQSIYENPNEEWSYIPGYGTRYLISNLGRIYSNDKCKFIRPDKNNCVSLVRDGESNGWSVHVLMGCTFLGNDINDPYRNRILFKDGNKSNLNLSNLYIEDTSDLPGEVWMPIKEASGRPVQDFYYVSNKGRVKGIKHEIKWINYGKESIKCVPEMILSQTMDDRGYYSVWLSALEKPDITASVHRLVASAFCENDDPTRRNVVNHIDGVPSNNCSENLEWCTNAENAQHAIVMGLKDTSKSLKLRYTVLHVETDKLYNSLSDVDRALGYHLGYCSNCLESGKPVIDKDGNVWTLEIFKDMERKIHTEGQHCIIDEFPGKEFKSLGEASLAIGRWEGYISDALSRGGVIRNKVGDDIHVHLVGDAPVVGANDIWKEKRKAGLVPDKKERKKSSWAPRKSVKCIETGEIFASFSDADRFLGRGPGYIGECFAYDRECFDRQGNKYTFELSDKLVKVHRSNNPCCFDEYPENTFSNLSEASLFIGRCSSYVNDRFKQGKPILTLDGKEIHLKLLQKTS